MIDKVNQIGYTKIKKLSNNKTKGLAKMKKVMTRAWEIAKQGQKKFGGNVKEFFAAALKMAWKEIKKMVDFGLEMLGGKNGTMFFCGK